MLLREIPLGLAGRVWASPMPFGDFDYNGGVYSSFREENISVVVMLTEDSENMMRAKRNLKNFYLSEGLAVLHLPVIDFSVPQKEEMAPLVTKAVELAREGKNIAVHCHAGLGRAGLFSACMAKTLFCMSGEEVMNWVTVNIPWVYWNTGQQTFVFRF